MYSENRILQQETESARTKINMNLITNVDRKQTKTLMQQYVANAGEKARDRSGPWSYKLRKSRAVARSKDKRQGEWEPHCALAGRWGRKESRTTSRATPPSPQPTRNHGTYSPSGQV